MAKLLAGGGPDWIGAAGPVWCFRKQLSAAWRYNLWLLVLIRLVMPSLPGSPISVFNLAKFSKLPVASAAPISSVLHGEIADRPAKSPAAENARSARETFLTQCRWLWAAGAVFFFIRIVCQNVRFATRLRSRSRLCDPAALELLEHCKLELNVRQSLALLETPLIKSPALYGLFRPKLLLPEGMTSTFTAPELRHVFLHELAHVKRCDMAVNWLMTALQGLHWFNPILWIAFNRMRADRELACDALALSCAKAEENCSYGETIIKLLEDLDRPTPLPGLIGILETRNQMRHRMSAIARFKKRRAWSPSSCLVLIGLGLITLTDAQTMKLDLKQTSLAEQTRDLDATVRVKSLTPLSETDQPVKVKVTAFDAETQQPVKISILYLLEGRASNLVSTAVFTTDPEPYGTDGQFNLSLEPSAIGYWIEVGAPDYDAQRTDWIGTTNRNQVLKIPLKKKAQSNSASTFPATGDLSLAADSGKDVQSYETK